MATQRLLDEIKTNETSWFDRCVFPVVADIYDPDRIEADRDLIRRFYLKHGYADVRVVSAVSVYDPAKKGFIVTFTLDEASAVGSARSIFSRTFRAGPEYAVQPFQGRSR
jgi:outer membrane protein insertion porin family